MKPGPKPKPVELRKREGTWRGDRHAAPILAPLIDELPAAPPELSAEGRAAWESAGRTMLDVGMLRAGHVPMLAAYARAVDVAAEAYAHIAEDGLVHGGSRGRGQVVSPWFRVWRDATSTVARLAEHIGASPSALTHLGVAATRGRTLQQELAEAYGLEASRGPGPR